MDQIDNILNFDNFKSLSQYDLLNIINLLKNEIRNLRINKNSNMDIVSNEIKKLNNEVQLLTLKIDELSKVNNNYQKIFFNNQLTKKERLTGKIDFKTRNSNE